MHTASLTEDACTALKRGEVIALPTDTVYGLAVDATQEDAVQKLVALKGKRENKPFSLQVGRYDMIEHFAEVSPLAKLLAQAFMPGPITLVLPARDESLLAPSLRNPEKTLGFRIPDHRGALEILKAYGRPLAVPSANRSGQPPLMDLTALKQEFGNSVAVYLPDFDKSHGMPSTVVKVEGSSYTILREGAVTATAIESVI